MTPTEATLDPRLDVFRGVRFRLLREEVHLNTPIPRHARIYVALHGMIVDGTLRGGTWIPSEPQLARFLLLAPSAVQPATRRLVAEDRLAHADGGGFVVNAVEAG